MVPLSVYIHFPWCVRKCPYCDFNSHTLRRELDETAYTAALLDDLEAERQHACGRRVTSIFFGGGTPSLFSPAAVDRVLNAVDQRLGIETDAEITLEANPGAADSSHFHGYRLAGVNRISLGAQTFNPGKLEELGRIHSPLDTVRAFESARRSGFDNINLDIMHGLPGQTVDDAVHDLDRALALQPEHLSWYQLTIEPDTHFAKAPPVLPEEDVLESMNVEGGARIRAAGFNRYEVSAWSRPGRQCRHNLNYWQFGDYLGVGAGAHGKFTLDGKVRRNHKVKRPDGYTAAAADGGAESGRTEVCGDSLRFEFLLNALRLEQGFDLTLFETRTGLDRTALDPELDSCRRRGWIDCTGQRVVATDLGRRFLNDVLEIFLPTPAAPQRAGAGSVLPVTLAR